PKLYDERTQSAPGILAIDTAFNIRYRKMGWAAEKRLAAQRKVGPKNLDRPAVGVPIHVDMINFEPDLKVMRFRKPSRWQKHVSDPLPSAFVFAGRLEVISSWPVRQDRVCARALRNTVRLGGVPGNAQFDQRSSERDLVLQRNEVPINGVRRRGRRRGEG